MSKNVEENVMENEKREANPNDLFKKMVLNDKEQNKRLSGLMFNGNGADNSKKVNQDPKRTYMRFIVCILGLLALTTSQMSRIVLNQSLPSMVDKSMKKSTTASTDGSCPAPTNTHKPTTNDSLTTVLPPIDLITDFNTESPIVTNIIDESVTTMLPFTTTTTTTTSNSDGYKLEEVEEHEEAKQGEEVVVAKLNNYNNNEDNHETFLWDNDYQSTILGAFYYGYFVFMIPGGRVAEAYGAKYVLFTSVAGSAIINLATPWMARNSFTLLVTSRVVLGAIQSGVFPGMYALFNEWLTMSEASIFAPLIKMNLRLGMMFGSGLCGLIQYNWPLTFYSTGLICAVWSVLWLFIATSSPKDSRWVSKSELDHINKKKRRKPKKETTSKSIEEGGQEIELTDRLTENKNNPTNVVKKDLIVDDDEKTPWLQLLTSPSVIGLVIVKLTFNYAIDFMVILLPNYLSNVFHAKPDTISYITLPMFGIQVILVVFVGWFAKYVIKERPYKLSKTVIRKIFQLSSNGGMAIFLILLTFNNCDIIYVALVLQIISFLSMFTAGGETMLPYDLSDKYPATIMAIANCVANLSGLTTTEISRQVLRGQPCSSDRWNILIYLIAGANIIGCIAFFALVKAEPLDLTQKRKRRNDSSSLQDDNNRPAIENETLSNRTNVATSEKMDSQQNNGETNKRTNLPIVSKEEENSDNSQVKTNVKLDANTDQKDVPD